MTTSPGVNPKIGGGALGGFAVKNPGPMEMATLSPKGIAFATSNPETTVPAPFSTDIASPTSKRSGSTGTPFKSLPDTTNQMASYPTSVSKVPGIANLAELGSSKAREFSG